MVVPPFWEHSAKGAAFGALFGGGVAAIGWIMRARNGAVIDLGAAPTPHLLAEHRALAETLLSFRCVSEHSATTRALYRQLVAHCEYVASHAHATGGKQVAVQKRVTSAVACAKRLAQEAMRFRDPRAYDCRAEVERVEGHLGGIQKNMMMA